jgi:hypothetical protein
MGTGKSESIAVDQRSSLLTLFLQRFVIKQQIGSSDIAKQRRFRLCDVGDSRSLHSKD